MTGSFFSLGDVTTDAFITLQDAKVDCILDTEECTISMRWGDKIPYEALTVVPAVGNSANAAVSTTRLGIPTAFVSFVGADSNGEACIEALEKEGVDTSYITREPGKTSNYHFVLSYEAERTILVRHEHFTYTLPNLPNDIDWLYISSLGEAAEKLHDDVVTWLEEHPKTKVVFQPGTFQMQLGYERLQTLYKKTNLFVCNKQEAQRILATDETDCRELIRMLRERGPEIVSVTDGPNGAYAFDGDTLLFVPQYPDSAPPKERTGAGDAYTSTLAAFLAKGYTLRESLERAPINAMSVVQHIGAQKGLLSAAELEIYLERAPKEYTVQTR